MNTRIDCRLTRSDCLNNTVDKLSLNQDTVKVTESRCMHQLIDSNQKYVQGFRKKLFRSLFGHIPLSAPTSVIFFE